MGGFHDLLEQAELVVGVEDGEAGGQPDQRRVPAQHAGAQRVEGAEPEPLRRPVEDGADPLAHLARRLVGEGHRQHLARERRARSAGCGRSAWSAPASCRCRRRPAPAPGRPRFPRPGAVRGSSGRDIRSCWRDARRHPRHIERDARTWPTRLRFLAWSGRQGSVLLALGIFGGVLVPPTGRGIPHVASRPTCWA